MSAQTREDAAMREFFATEGSMMPARIGYVLEAADAWDKANKVHRISLDSEAIERAARTFLWRIPELGANPAVAMDHVRAIAEALGAKKR